MSLGANILNEVKQGALAIGFLLNTVRPVPGREIALGNAYLRSDYPVLAAAYPGAVTFGATSAHGGNTGTTSEQFNRGYLTIWAGTTHLLFLNGVGVKQSNSVSVSGYGSTIAPSNFPATYYDADYDPVADVVMVVSSTGIWRSTNKGTTWTRISTVSTAFISYAGGGVWIAHMAPTASNRASFRKSTDDGASFAEVQTAVGLAPSTQAISVPNTNDQGGDAEFGYFEGSDSGSQTVTGTLTGVTVDTFTADGSEVIALVREQYTSGAYQTVGTGDSTVYNRSGAVVNFVRLYRSTDKLVAATRGVILSTPFVAQSPSEAQLIRKGDVLAIAVGNTVYSSPLTDGLTWTSRLNAAQQVVHVEFGLNTWVVVSVSYGNSDANQSGTVYRSVNSLVTTPALTSTQLPGLSSSTDPKAVSFGPVAQRWVVTHQTAQWVANDESFTLATTSGFTHVRAR